MTVLFGCAYHTGLVAEEREAIRSGKVALVLLRVTCDIVGTPFECFGKNTLPGGQNVGFGLGSFETAGVPRAIQERFLSETSLAAGWTFLLLPPGSHYLAVMAPPVLGDYREVPRWRIDVQDNSKLIYVGTLHSSGRERTLGSGVKVLDTSNLGSVQNLADETALARDVLSDHFENANEMTTNLMVRWRPGDPIIIRSSKPVPTR